MTELIAAVFSVLIMLLGCSVLLQANTWIQWARRLVDEPGNIMLLSMALLPMGLVIVFGHNIWVWEWRVIVTLFGWIIVIKYGLYLLWPQVASYFRGWFEYDLSLPLRLAGIVYIVAGGASSWQLLLA